MLDLQKLEHRLATPETTPLREEDKQKTLQLLSSPSALHYISSEESDGDFSGTGPRPRKVIKLSFERTKLRNIKAALDDHRRKSMTENQKRTAAVVRQSEEVSERKAPEGSPRWAVRLN